MIELRHDALEFLFPEVHHSARLRVEFQRTLRIPDDGRNYALPPGLGRFPLRHVDDFAARLPATWRERGGVMLPMYQSEALWISFRADTDAERGVGYPFAVKVAAGKVNAATGEPWRPSLHRSPQDYLVVPEQPWLDGFVVEKGTIRQFVAMPLGAGYTAEEQLTGTAVHGGLQIMAYPMKRDAFERRFPPGTVREAPLRGGVLFSTPTLAASFDMGLGAGGRMRQEVFADPFDTAEWDTSSPTRCFVHLTNSLVWHAVTGEAPPTAPPTAAEYTRRGLPWFEYYGEGSALEATRTLERLRSVLDLAREKGDVPLPENEPVDPAHVMVLKPPRRSRDQVREGAL
ncbi:MAG TPA: hypothetical protein VHJ69_03150 [Gemmatimonadales bacterium]|jgi:hypothetical protein|nr:hypothetical protein [Gemmatimonadales bacterium]